MIRITTDPRLCHGKPIITGTRIMVQNILGMMAGGYSMTNKIIDSSPELTAEYVQAALEYAAESKLFSNRGAHRKNWNSRPATSSCKPYALPIPGWAC